MATGNRLLAGRYQLLNEVGHGDLTVVYRAEDRAEDDRPVAVKVVRDTYSNNPDVVERFLARAAAAERLRGPHIVDVYASGEQGGLYYLVAEWVEGPSLRKLLDRQGRPLAPVEAARMAVQVAQALEGAHSLGAVHGGVRPENVLINSAGRAQVSDFGLSGALEGIEPPGGNPYCPPEQAQGAPPDVSADLYALGIVLLEMVAGTRARDAFADWRDRRQREAVNPPSPRSFAPELPPMVESIILRALRYNPAERYASAAELARDLEAFLESQDQPTMAYSGTTVVAAPPGPVVRQTVVPVSQVVAPAWWPYAAVAGVLLFVLCMLAGMLLGLFNPAAERLAPVPNLVGLSVDEANRVAERAGFSVAIVERRTDTTLPENTVIAQTPEPGSQRLRGESIAIVVAQAPTVVPLQPVPSVVGQPEASARVLIESAGFRAGISSQRADPTAAGTVLEQNPRAGLMLAPGSTIDLVVSSGPATTPLPPSATPEPAGCRGDELIAFNPPLPSLHQPVLIDVYSSRAHSGVALTGPGSPQFVGLTPEGQTYHWQWQAVPSVPGRYEYIFSVSGGEACARNAFEIGSPPATPAPATATRPAPGTPPPSETTPVPPTPTLPPGPPPVTFLRTWGTSGTGQGQLRSPTGLAVVGDRVLVADTNNDRVELFDLSGRYLSEWSDDLNQPQAVAGRPDGAIVVADTNNHRIQIRDVNGGVLRQFGREGSAAGELRWPRGVALDSQGTIYVADTNNHRVQLFNGSGNVLVMFGVLGPGPGQFNHPTGVAVDGGGRIYIVDRDNHRVQWVASDGRFGGSWGGFGAGSGQFNTPSALALDGAGNVYVVDTGNHRVQKFDRDGRFLLAWGTRGRAEGQFESPRGIAIAADGTIFVADTGNDRIQAFR
jgi:DNA-binding beta-propeller fold protein YncE